MEMVDLIVESSASVARWRPVIGEETLDLLESLGLQGAARKNVLDQAVGVLGRCVPPSLDTGSDTGLVIGYVQSGKTLSFTTVTALARDNGYQLVIVIAGTAIPLLQQSTKRLVKDLRLDTRDDRKWLLVESRKKIGEADRVSVRDTLAEWSDLTVPTSQRRTVLITVMKHHTHLGRVIDLLDWLKLEGIKVLVIDDEADQASLNAAVRKKEETATYSKLKALRNVLQHQTLLQYTATPQAPLLINIIDILSPNFAEVLTPGPEYVGGKDFFVDRPELVEVIPAGELPVSGPLTEPPDSLMRALRIFFIGVAAGYKLEEGRGNRSMMVHPSQSRAGHGEYYSWIREAKDAWAELLHPQSSYEHDRHELLADFRVAYDDLAATVEGLPSFEELVPSLHHAVRRTRLEVVNAASGVTPEVRWKENYAHILVGGQAMDRGFTVEGLTVTYMPRSLGIGNADTVQQRARFFGYKRKYLGYCRVFLEQAMIDAYTKYVTHEEDVRRRLVSFNDTGDTLAQWKRTFLLNRSLKPTRQSVLDLDYMRNSAKSEWYTPSMPHASEEAVIENLHHVEAFRTTLPLVPDSGSDMRSDPQRHLVAEAVPLREALEQLLVNLRFTDAADSQEFLFVQLLILEQLDRHPDSLCSVYFMSGGAIRKRSVDPGGTIKNLYQGAAPVNPPELRGSVYPGDKEIRAPSGQITIQVHMLEVEDKAKGVVLAKKVPTVAVYIPAGLAHDLLVQDQPAQA
jgi:hypothetical protein